ncbi:MAG TPA: right-handed parallel beta-helix repeat-containing protein [Egibacteraceae bacterium]|nr:right-handed parallel beta-helix repeat-containing protein [Egibacteraceae bacterium]
MMVMGSGLTAPAGATSVSCGQVITRHTVLQADVGPCPDNGIVVGADNVRLNLNGYRILGTPQTGDGAGVLVVERRGVHVTNGTVSDFDAGVAIVGGGGNRVAQVTARDNIGQARVPSQGIAGTRYGDGIAILSSSDNLLLRNVAENNGPFAGIGLYAEIDADHPREIGGPTRNNVVNGNVVRDNRACRTPTGPCDNDGIRLEPGVQANLIVNNEVTGSGLDGIAVFSRNTTDNEIKHNVVRGNGFHHVGHRKGDGIRVFGRNVALNLPGGDRTLIENNQVFGNAANGIRVDAQFSRIINNKTGANVQVVDPRFFLQSDLHDSNEDCDANVWSGNTFDKAYPDCTKG